MPITVREPESKFKAAPQGLHAAVCVDILPVWTEDRPEEYGGGIVDKTRIVWMIDEKMEDGRPYVTSKKYTPSLHEKATLNKDLTSWRGRAFTAEEKKAFDLEKLIGVCCQLQIVHNVKGDRTYANVTSIVPLAKGQQKLEIPKDYVRQKDRDDAKPPVEFQAEDSDVPF